MDFKTLHYFVTAATELNITRAAEILNMSQPPLSHTISQLEKDLGTTLFIRKKTGLTLTPTGRILLQRAGQILELAAKTREEIASHEKELSGNLVLGTVEGRAPFLLAGWIAGFREEFPLVSFTVRHGGTDDLMEQMQHHQMDLAIIAAPYDEERLNGFPVDTQPWVAIIPAGHPLAEKEGTSILLADLAGEPLIVPERSYRRTAIERWFEAQGLQPRFVCRSSTYTDAIALVEQNVGICIFPHTTYTPNPHIVSRLITNPPKLAQYVLVWPKSAMIPELAAAFRDYVKDTREQEDGSDKLNPEAVPFILPRDAELL